MYILIHCGGSTFQGLAIYNLLKQHKAQINTYVDGIAASSASIIAMAGDKIYMPKTSLMMIHNCWTYTMGNAKELRKTAADMDKIAVAYKEAYLDKIKIDEDKLNQLLEDETYLTAKECIEMGFADEIIESKEENNVNQYANMSILRLVNKVKESKNEYKNNTLNDEIINKIAEKISKILEQSAKEIANKIIEQNCKGSAKEEPTGLNNQIKEDAWTSFFYTKINEKEGKENEN